MKHLALLLLPATLLAGCPEFRSTPPWETDATPFRFDEVTASAAFVTVDDVLVLSFVSSRALPVGARDAKPNPEVRFGDAPMTCTNEVRAYQCTLLITDDVPEGSTRFSLTGHDGTSELSDQPTLSVTVDRTAPVLTVSATPQPAIKGQGITFIVTSNEALAEPPAIEAGFVTSSPACAGSGTSFVCSGANVSSDAAIGAAGYIASARDRAGNQVSAPAQVVLVDPAAGVPAITFGSVAPNPARPGDTLTITFAADQALVSCSATLVGQAADCVVDTPKSCLCSFLVGENLPEGAVTVSVTGTSLASGLGVSTVNIDKTAPAVDASKLVILRRPMGVADEVEGAAGAAYEQGPVYQGRAVATVRIWDAATEGTLRAEATVNEDGSIAAVTLADSDGLSETSLAPRRLWVAPVDRAGHEGPRLEIEAGRDLDLPGGHPETLVLVRRAFGERDGIAAGQGTFSDSTSALQPAAYVFDAPVDGQLLGEVTLDGEGGFAELALGSDDAAPAHVWVEVVDKTGQRARVTAGVGAREAFVVDDARLSLIRHDLSLPDEVEGDAGAFVHPCAARVTVFDAPSGGQSHGAAHADAAGGFPAIPVGTGTASFSTLWVEASSKCDAAAVRVEVLNGRDTEPPVLSPSSFTFFVRPVGTAEELEAAAGAVTDDHAVRSVEVFVDPQGPSIATLVPSVADGSVARQGLGDLAGQQELFVSATDKAGNVSSPVRVGRVDARLTLAGREPYTTQPTGVTMFGSAAGDARDFGPGAAIYAGEVSAADSAAAAAIDGAMATTQVYGSDDNNEQGWSSDTPGARIGHAMAYDPERERVVLFGGTQDGRLMDDVWEWDGTAWHGPFRPATRPEARQGHTMGYLSSHRAVVLFAGETASDVQRDLWTWDGSAWGLLDFNAPPDARTGHSMTSTDDSLWIFGGRNGQVFHDDLWSWNGSGWNERSSTTYPPARSGHAMGFDSVNQRVVIFGGESQYSGVLDDLWTWRSGFGWQKANPFNAPPARARHSLVPLPDGQGFRLLGGRNAEDEPVGDAWEWDGSTWMPGVGTPALDERFGQAVASSRDGQVVFGGTGGKGGNLGDLWLDTVRGGWTRQQMRASGPTTRQNHAFVHDSHRALTVLYGGDDDGVLATDEMWQWNGSGWEELDASTGPGGRTRHGMVYDAMRRRMVVFGGANASGWLDDVWEWDGETWFGPFSPPSRPSARVEFAFGYDPVRARTVLFGGANASGQKQRDAWEWDGTRWHGPFSFASNAPDAVVGASLTFDPVTSRMLLFGGDNGYVTSEMYAWNGSAWSSLGSGQRPPPRSHHAVTWDAERGRLILVGGYDDSYPSTLRRDHWEWDGEYWNELSPSDTWFPRTARTGLAYDAARRQTVLFGGETNDRSNAQWTFTARRSYARKAAHTVLFPLPVQAQLETLAATWVGSAVGGYGQSGAAVSLWRSSTSLRGSWQNFESYQSSSGVATLRASGITPLFLQEYGQQGRVWFKVESFAQTLDSSVPASLSTDFVTLDVTYTLP